jgi:hypothetical protein
VIKDFTQCGNKGSLTNLRYLQAQSDLLLFQYLPTFSATPV